MPREFEAYPCDLQKQTLEGLGFTYHETGSAAGKVCWTGHGMSFEVQGTAPVTPEMAASIIVSAAREQGKKQITEPIRKAFSFLRWSPDPL